MGVGQHGGWGSVGDGAAWGWGSRGVGHMVVEQHGVGQEGVGQHLILIW